MFESIRQAYHRDPDEKVGLRLARGNDLIFNRLLTALGFLILAGGATWQGEAASADAHRGLWVGQVTLNYVNEVTVPLDEDNVRVAPDPEVPTPTADQAHLRLILHVNGAGQVSLLKDVAVLKRGTGNGPGGVGEVVNLQLEQSLLDLSEGLDSESDVALVTDERLYGEFPPQPAIRIASAVYDFGDSRATEALNAVVAAAVQTAAGHVQSNQTQDFGTVAGRLEATSLASQAAVDFVREDEAIIQNADVSAAFDSFLSEDFPGTTVDAIAEADDPEAKAEELVGEAAEELRDRSFYQDGRGIRMMNRVAEAVEAAGTPEEKREAAHHAAAAYADVADQYHRFIAGKLFGDMIDAAAATAAKAATADGATEESIRAAVNGNDVVNEARAEALRIQVPEYDDTRAVTAVEQVLEAVIGPALDGLAGGSPAEDVIQAEAKAAGRDTLASEVPRYPVSSQVPSAEYTAFIRSEGFQQSAESAAQAAAEAAVFERSNNPLYTQASLEGAALVAATGALDDVFSAAARAVRTELPMTGVLGPGSGDPRLRALLDPDDQPLGDAGLEVTLYLPANHPTNPFRHRRHPSHTRGFDIRRKIRLDFDGSEGDPLARSGFGVDRLTGTYREEIFGLHKELGPDQDIGLRVEGTFELNRISLIDTLNAR